MLEHVYGVEWSDIRMSVFLYADAFRLMGSQERSMGVLAQWKSIHQHSTYELFFVTEGELSLVTERETLTVRNSVLAVPPRFSHYAELPESVKGYFLYFSLEQIPGKEGNLYEDVTSFLANRVVTLALGEEERFYLEKIDRALEAGKNGKERVSHLLFLLMEGIFGYGMPHEQGEAVPKELYRKHVNRMEEYLVDHFCDPICLSDLASALYLCPKQVTRIIRREYGCGFSELIAKRRLSAACMLLKYTGMEIGEVARRVGYEYENYFYTVFRRYYGKTPAQYRKESREER